MSNRIRERITTVVPVTPYRPTDDGRVDGGTSAALYDRLVGRTGRHALVGAAVALWVVGFVAAGALSAVEGIALLVALTRR
ncbi:hypothetical protein [Halorubrum sp. Boch-26]|uniref:hypothetical protein n=1 Tax=Halorubrum sp. Boch-26 TaxID=2994426 RepID=UPI0024694888|nr:hypothetical protein [Halorubrum sp. Boch-26]